MTVPCIKNVTVISILLQINPNVKHISSLCPYLFIQPNLCSFQSLHPSNFHNNFDSSYHLVTIFSDVPSSVTWDFVNIIYKAQFHLFQECWLMQFKHCLDFPDVVSKQVETFPTLINIASKCNNDVQRLQNFT